MYQSKNIISITKRFFARKKLFIDINDEAVKKSGELFEQEFGIEQVSYKNESQLPTYGILFLQLSSSKLRKFKINRRTRRNL